MLLYIYLGILVLVGLYFAIQEARASLKNRRDPHASSKSPKTITKEALGTFGIVFLLGITVGTVLFGIIATIARVAEGSPATHQVVNQEVYQIAPNTKFENTDDSMTFTFVNENGTFEAKHVEFDSIRVFDANNDTIIVAKEQIVREWLFPWVMDSDTVVSIH